MDIKLVAYQSAFLDSFIEWRHQPSSVRHNPLQFMSRQEIEQERESEGSDLSQLSRYSAYRWFVEYEGKVVGSVALKNLNLVMMHAELGYGMNEDYMGRGIATAAVEQVTNLAFAQSPLRKLIAYVHDKNLASCRVLEKLSFVREGLLREHYIINGVPENEVFFGLLRQDWANRKLPTRRPVPPDFEMDDFSVK